MFPIMLALCLMLTKTYYAQIYAGMIGLGPPLVQYLQRQRHMHLFCKYVVQCIFYQSTPSYSFFNKGLLCILVYSYLRIVSFQNNQLMTS